MHRAKVQFCGICKKWDMMTRINGECIVPMKQIKTPASVQVKKLHPIPYNFGGNCDFFEMIDDKEKERREKFEG